MKRRIALLLCLFLTLPILTGNGSDWWHSPEAESIPFDPETSGLVSEQVGPALREISDKIIDVASPGYVFTKSGSVKNAWLLVGIVPSNVAGINFGFFNGLLSSMTVANEQVNTFDVELYEHDGTVYTLLTTVSLIAARSDEFDFSDFGTVNVTKGKELAVKVSSGTGKNVIVSVQISGTLTP